MGRHLKSIPSIFGESLGLDSEYFGGPSLGIDSEYFWGGPSLGIDSNFVPSDSGVGINSEYSWLLIRVFSVLDCHSESILSVSGIGSE